MEYPQTIDELLARTDPVSVLEQMIKKDPKTAKKVCTAIRDGNTFYDKAAKAGIKTFVRNTMIVLCDKVDDEKPALPDYEKPIITSCSKGQNSRKAYSYKKTGQP